MSERKTTTKTWKVPTPQSLKRSGENSNQALSRSLGKTAKKIASNIILDVLDSDNKEDKGRKRTRTARYKTGSTQADIPIQSIKNGIILTKDGRYISFIEILPIGFYKKDVLVRNRVLHSFGKLFVNGAYKMQFKVMTDLASPYALEESIRKNCRNKNNPKVKRALEEYISFLNNQCKNGSSFSRFFLIFQYEDKNEGTIGKEKSFDEIAMLMNEQRYHYISILEECGNVCVDGINPDMQTLEFLYYFFNRNTIRNESFTERVLRTKNDFKEFNDKTDKKKSIIYPDLFAPKGIDYRHREYVVMDGLYYGFLGVTSSTFPDLVSGGWLDNFKFGSMVDIDVICKRIPRQSSLFALKQMNRVNRKTAEGAYHDNKAERYATLAERLNNNTEIANALKNGRDLYDIAIIITIKANTARQLGSAMRMIQSSLSNYQIKLDDSFLCAEDYLLMTMPFLYITSPFARLSHNILSDRMESLYPFTNEQLFDASGFFIGVTDDKKETMVAINNFNKTMFKNANMLILGTSGAGKTYTQQLIAERILFNGVRCFFIIPSKGYEYYRGSEMVGGSYVSLTPSSKATVNVMEIRPEGEADTSQFDDDTTFTKASLRAKKITELVTWVQILLGKDFESRKIHALLNTRLVEVYEKYGITDDNNSIWQDKQQGILKQMPIISDMYEAFSKDKELEEICIALEIFTKGNCSNFNGQTNIDLNNPYVVFDVDEDVIGSELLPALLYIAYIFVYGTVKENIQSRDIIVMDEVWKLMSTPSCAKQVENMVRIVRGYKASAIMATQQISEFLNSSGGFGKSVINNTEIKLLLNMKEEDLALTQDILRLTDEDVENILAFKRGHGMLIANRDKINIEIKSSEYEYSFLSDK